MRSSTYVLYLSLMLAASSCGPQQVRVSGEVTHRFEVDLVTLEKYFKALCEAEKAADVQACTTLKQAQFLEFMMTSK